MFGHRLDCFIIAEIGINHMGNYKLAKEMIATAFKAGANAAKLQIVNPDESYEKNTDSYKVFKKAYLEKNLINKLVDNFKNKGYVFATPGDISSLNICVNSKMRLYKISSGLASNHFLVSQIAKTNKPVIFSTGLCDLFEIKKLIKMIRKFGGKKIGVLHCIPSYPANEDSLNLKIINKLIELDKNITVGYSDHTKGWLASNNAVAMGAKIIEKHYILNYDIQGADRKVSLDFKDFKEMVNNIRSTERMLGNKEIILNKKLLSMKANMIRYCVSNTLMNKGEKVMSNNVLFKRVKKYSNSFIKASDFSSIENKKLKRKIHAGSIFKIDHFL